LPGVHARTGGRDLGYACRTTASDDSLNVFEDAAISGRDSVV